MFVTCTLVGTIIIQSPMIDSIDSWSAHNYSADSSVYVDVRQL